MASNTARKHTGLCESGAAPRTLTFSTALRNTLDSKSTFARQQHGCHAAALFYYSLAPSGLHQTQSTLVHRAHACGKFCREAGASNSGCWCLLAMTSGGTSADHPSQCGEWRDRFVHLGLKGAGGCAPAGCQTHLRSGPSATARGPRWNSRRPAARRAGDGAAVAAAVHGSVHADCSAAHDCTRVR